MEIHVDMRLLAEVRQQWRFVSQHHLCLASLPFDRVNSSRCCCNECRWVRLSMKRRNRSTNSRQCGHRFLRARSLGKTLVLTRDFQCLLNRQTHLDKTFDNIIHVVAIWCFWEQILLYDGSITMCHLQDCSSTYNPPEKPPKALQAMFYCHLRS